MISSLSASLSHQVPLQVTVMVVVEGLTTMVCCEYCPHTNHMSIHGHMHIECSIAVYICMHAGQGPWLLCTNVYFHNVYLSGS